MKTYYDYAKKLEEVLEDFDARYAVGNLTVIEVFPEIEVELNSYWDTEDEDYVDIYPNWGDEVYDNQKPILDKVVKYSFNKSFREM
jgi:hypothetical protein